MFKRRYLWLVSAVLLTLAAHAQDVVESSRGETTEKQAGEFCLGIDSGSFLRSPPS